MQPVFHHHYRTWKRLWPMFGLWDPDVGKHLIRLFALYEDLRIEYHAFYSDGLGELDQASVPYRRLYFLRRLYVTIFEIVGAIHVLNRSDEFRASLEKGGKGQITAWSEAETFLQANHKIIKDRRNIYGGHYSDDAAEHVLKHMDQDTTGALLVSEDPHAGYSRVVFEFAMELVGHAVSFDIQGMDAKTFVEEGHQFVADAMKHAHHAIQAVADVHVLPYYGVPIKKF